jgi:hypothetical protein
LSHGKAPCGDYSQTRLGLDSTREYPVFSALDTSATKIITLERATSARDANARAFVSYALKKYAHGGAANTSATPPLRS